MNAAAPWALPLETIELARAGAPFPRAAFAKPCYRIPALTTTSTGRLLAVFDVRSDWRDLPGDFDLGLRHSDDGGSTWSPARPLRGHAQGVGFGDASLTTDPASGRVLCWYAGSRGRSFFSADADGEGLELWLSVSQDDGLTWTHRDLSYLRPSGVSGMFASSGNGTVTASGRLLQPFVLRRDGRHYAAAGYSDDGGETWGLGDVVGPDCDENKLLGLVGGGVLMHARATPMRRVARSADGVSFSQPVPDQALIDPACNGGLAQLADAVICTCLDDPAERRRLSIRVSRDQGITWGDALVLDSGAAAYSVAVPLADDSLGVAWESGDYEAILFARITPEHLGLTGCTPTLIAHPGRPGVAKPPAVAN